MTTKPGNKRRSNDYNNLSGPPSKRRLMQIPPKTLENLTFEETRKLGQNLVQSSKMFLERGQLKPKLDKGKTNWEEAEVECDNREEKEIHLKKAKALYHRELRCHKVKAQKKIESELKLINRRWDEETNLALIEKQVQIDIKKDEELNGYYHRDIRETMDLRILDFLVRNLRFQFGQTRGNKISFSRSLIPHLPNTKYEPPKIRTTLATMRTITGKQTVHLCDIPNTNLSCFPNELVFKHIDKNFVDEEKYPELVKFTKKAESDQYVIRCSCCKKGSKPIVPCWQNPNCQCFKVNQQLQEMQYETNEGHKEVTNFHTFRPKLVSDLDYSHTIGFACSELCGCKGKCDNNVTLIPEKNVFPLEVFRRNAEMGFGIRTTAAIPAGTLVKEFTGELMNSDLMETVDEDYAYMLTTRFNESIKRFQGADETWDDDFKEELKTQLCNNWYINPKRKGNIARLFSHSCFPNLSAVQVYQKGFSPAHCRLFLATQKDVFPGVELTFNYGPAFLKQIIGNACLCKSIACQSTPGFKKFSRLSNSALKSFCALQHFDGFQKFQKVLHNATNAQFLSNIKK